MAEDRKYFRLATGEHQGKYGVLTVDDAGGVGVIGPQHFSDHSQALNWLNATITKAAKVDRLESTVNQLATYVAGLNQEMKEVREALKARGATP